MVAHRWVGHAHRSLQELRPPAQAKGETAAVQQQVLRALQIRTFSHPGRRFCGQNDGTPKVEALRTFLDAGKIHQPDLVSGQHQGGAAMGVGYALFEEMPAGTDGPGNGRWNLDRYHVPLAGDLPLDKMDLVLLDPQGKDPKGKGIAESVLCPVAPAIANALCDATGHQFTSIPITREQIKEVLS
jgi:CO/xanthine dehydrogenase Mo-binding subunit